MFSGPTIIVLRRLLITRTGISQTPKHRYLLGLTRVYRSTQAWPLKKLLMNRTILNLNLPLPVIMTTFQKRAYHSHWGKAPREPKTIVSVFQSYQSSDKPKSMLIPSPASHRLTKRPLVVFRIWKDPRELLVMRRTRIRVCLAEKSIWLARPITSSTLLRTITAKRCPKSPVSKG